MQNPDCLFCKFVAGTLPCHKVYEDEKHLAFLSIFPNTEGVTVVIPKDHCHSYVFMNTDEVISELMLAAKKVAMQIDAAFPDVGRTGVIFEGFGIDHLHAKLFPMHDTAHTLQEWQAIESKHAFEKPKRFFERYEGYLSSHDCPEMENERLAKIAERIRAAAV